MKIGIISGTFDPVHEGHLAMAQLAMNDIGLNEVLFLPEKFPRNKQKVTDYKHRVQMLGLVVKNKHRFFVVGVSQDSHNLETLKEVTKHYHEDTNHELFLLVGADVAKQMQSWDNIGQIQNLAKVVSIGRNGEEADLNFENDASSKTIREQIANGHRPKNLDEKVLEYIYEHKLYKS